MRGKSQKRRGRTVVRESADHLDHQAASTDGVTTTTDAEVSVLPQKAGILLVDADDVLDDYGGPIMRCVSTRLCTERVLEQRARFH